MTIIAVGMNVQMALAAAEKLAAERTAMAAQIAAKGEKLQAEIAEL